MKKAIFLPALLIAIVSCVQESNTDYKSELLSLHEIQRKAHLENDADLLVSVMADTLTMVQSGTVQSVAKEDVRTRFSQYFKTIHYKKWDNIKTPILSISDDGSLATMTVEMEMETASVVDGVKGEYSKGYWAWIAIYKKIEGEWKLFSMSSGVKG